MKSDVRSSPLENCASSRRTTNLSCEVSGDGPPNASESGCGDGEAAPCLAPSASRASPGRTGGLGSAAVLIADGRAKGIGICPRDKVRTPLGPSHGLPRLPTAFLRARFEGIVPPSRPPETR